MNKFSFLIISLLFVHCSSRSKTTTTEAQINTPEVTAEGSSSMMAVKNFHYFSLKSLDETGTINMGDFKGKKILVVNVASKCGYTPQYEGLQKLHELHGDKIQVIGFPCNQFMGQEPGEKEEIATFCKKNFGVTFPLTTKIDVKGKNQHPIYSWLTHKNENQVGDYKASWNFNKFLIDSEGKLLKHYGPKTKPMSEELLAAILN